MNLIKNSNIILAFLLEISAIFILGYWGINLPINKAISVTIGLSLPVSIIVIWSIFCAPSSNYRLEGLWIILVKSIIYAIVIYCLFSMGHTTSAIIFGFFVLINLGLSIYFKTL